MTTRPRSVLAFALLGGFAAHAAGRPIRLRARKDRALIAYLALNTARRHSRDRLAGLLWGDVRGDPRQSLRQSLSSITYAIGAAHRPALRALRIDRDEVGLDPAAVAVDVGRLSRLAASDRIADLEAASNLFTGAVLEDLGRLSPAFDAWLTLERDNLVTTAGAGLRRLLDLYNASGRTEDAIAAAARLVAVDPFHEAARRELMLLYAECGRTDAAIAQYDAYAALLQSELGAEPAEATRDLARLLRDGSMPPRTRGSRAARAPLPARRRPAADASDAFLQMSVTVLEQMPDCVIVTDLAGRIVGWNRWARENFGYERRDVLGRKPIFLYGPGADETLTATLIEKAVRYGRWSGVLRLFNKDGSSRLHQRTMMPVRDTVGRVVGVFGVTRPLTRPVPGL